MQKAEEQRRIAERRQGPTDIADQENKEDDGVRLSFAKLISPDDRPDQQHRCTGRANPAGQ